jgi:hypothetical protein
MRLGRDRRAKTLMALRAKILSHRLHGYNINICEKQDSKHTDIHTLNQAGRGNGHLALSRRRLSATNRSSCLTQILVTRCPSLTFLGMVTHQVRRLWSSVKHNTHRHVDLIIDGFSVLQWNARDLQANCRRFKLLIQEKKNFFQLYVYRKLA